RASAPLGSVMRGRARPLWPVWTDKSSKLGLALGVLAERRLGGGEPRDRHAERRARHVIEPDLVTEGDRGGSAAVLAPNAELDVGPHLLPALDCDAHQFAHAVAIERDERIDRQDALAGVGAEEARRVVARNPECGLR